MRFGMGLFKNEYGVFHVRRMVPAALRGPVARVMGAPKESVSWLKKTLGTKDEKRARILAKPIMMEFDRIIAQGEALLDAIAARFDLVQESHERLDCVQ